MKRMSVFGMTTALFTIGLVAEIQADVILDEPNLKGTVGLTGESFGSGQVYAYWNGGSINTQLTNGDIDFALRVEPGKTSSLSVYMYSFQNTPGAQLNQYLTGIAALGPAEVRTLDLKREAGRIRGSINVTGGSVKRIQMQTSAQASSTESYSGYVTATTAPFTPLQPMPALSNTKVSGTAIFAANAGCDVSVSLQEKSAAVSAGGTVDVNWTVDLSTVQCNLGGIQGDVALSGLNGVNTDASVSQHTVSVSGPVLSSKTLTADGNYLISNLPAGSYYVGLSSSFKSPYGSLSYFSNNVSVLGGQVATHNLLKSVGTLHGTIEPKGLWDRSNVNNLLAYFQPNSGGSSFYDYVDLPTGKFDIVAPAGNLYLYYLRPYFSFNDKGGRHTSQYYYRYYNAAQNPVQIAMQEGDRLTDRDIELETSQAEQGFSLITEISINRLRITGSDGLKRIDLTNSGTAGKTVLVTIHGEPGTYQLTAVADAADGGTYSKPFTLMLGKPGNTSLGQNIVLNFDPLGSVTFNNVSVAGSTALNLSTAGPKPPSNFKVFGSGLGNQYYDISSTAGFDSALVCLKYDDSQVNGQEENLKLAHYDSVNGDWDIISDDAPAPNPDTSNNIICGKTTSFSIFAILEPIDQDGDGIVDSSDNCPETPNADQKDLDKDWFGDACDSDIDGDGIVDDEDRCPLIASTNNNDLDGDGFGDVCDNDIDGDEVANEADNCPLNANSNQVDFDSDGKGDACDLDDDNDDIEDSADNCAGTEAGVLIDGKGCSSAQRFVLACPPSAMYQNHGKYVSCIAKEAERQLAEKLITEETKDAAVSAAAQSGVGK